MCVHNLRRAPAEPDTLYLQFHGGVYRSDDAASTWHPIADGLPSDFGLPMVVDPGDPDRAFVIPLVSEMDRVTVEGKVRVYETRKPCAKGRPRLLRCPNFSTGADRHPFHLAQEERGRGCSRLTPATVGGAPALSAYTGTRTPPGPSAGLRIRIADEPTAV